MFIKVYNSNVKYALFRSQLLIAAATYIKNWQLLPKEQELNKYLINTFDLTLVEAALQLLRKVRLQVVDANEMVITFVEDKYDSLATLITYGNGIFPGSKILVNSFKRAQGEL